MIDKRDMVMWGIASRWILPSDKAYTVVYTTTAMRLTIPYGVSFSISGAVSRQPLAFGIQNVLGG